MGSGRIDDAFSHRKTQAGHDKTLIAYLCCGDPDEHESVDLAVACAEAGADVLELGMPFSDPTADGPAIARASQRALANGGGLEATLRVARAVRARSAVPIVLFGYYNPLFVRSEERVVGLAADAGVDAFLIVDLPIDESLSLRELAVKRDLSVIPLVAPTSTPARIAKIGELSASFPIPFIYYVSMMGVTGGSGITSVLTEASAQAAKVRGVTGRPTIVGFGIDSASAARAAGREADGIAVGTAIVRRIEDGTSPEARLSAVRALVTDLRGAV